jgi:Secretion system C-terminal sorting domain
LEKHEFYYPGYTNIHNSIKLSSLKVYPNPTSNKLTVIFPDYNFSAAQIQMFDMIGRKVLDHSNIENQMFFDIILPNLKSGVYILNVSIDNNSHSEKIIIKN